MSFRCRNSDTDPQVHVGDALQEQDGALCGPDARDHRLPDGVPAVPHGHPGVSHLHREL